MMLSRWGLESDDNMDTFPGKCASGTHTLKYTFSHNFRPVTEPQEAQGPRLRALVSLLWTVS